MPSGLSQIFLMKLLPLLDQKHHIDRETLITDQFPPASSAPRKDERLSSGRGKRGYKIVLTAPRSLMSEYNLLLFFGFCATAPIRTLWSDWFYYKVIAPIVPTGERGEALYAPCGTRKIEAALLDHGFNEEEVIVTTPENLHNVVGSNTKIIGITANDPLGMASHDNILQYHQEGGLSRKRVQGTCYRPPSQTVGSEDRRRRVRGLAT